MIMLVLLALTGCGKDESEPVFSQETPPENLVISTKDKNQYEFVDVEGNQYQAELLKDVPYTAYKMEQLIEENGFKFYTDEDGEITSKIGVDVSKYQEEIDWEEVKESGIEFAIIRLGFRGYGESGKLVEDEYFKSNIEGALDAGLEVGVYFFSQAISKEEALEEAEFVLGKIKDYEITCPVVFDTEEIKNDEARTDNLTNEEFTSNCIAFCDIIEEAGYKPMIYANMKWMAYTLELEKLTKYEKWYADYEAFPQNPYEISMWQYTETGSVAGIEGNVDLNISYIGR
jgi:GH25 family lysozyme M1 (1,4-beta-N-acetylmuramidase)